jgi:hypothetical protein
MMIPKEPLNKYRGMGGWGEGRHQRSRKALIFILPPIGTSRKGTLIEARSDLIGVSPIQREGGFSVAC